MDWVLYMLQAVAETSARTLEMIRQIGELRVAMLEDARVSLRSGPVRELVDLMFSYPYLKIRTLEDAGVAKRQTASNYLHTLAGAGLLQTRKEGKEVYFINQKLLDVVAGK